MSNKRQKEILKKQIGSLVALLMLAPFYQNCGGGFEASKKLSSAVDTLNIPAQELPFIGPQIEMAAEPPTLLNKTSLTLSFNVRLDARIKTANVTCQLDSNAAKNCLDGKMVLTDLTQGSHVVLIQATDSKSQIAPEKRLVFTVDTVPPVITVSQSPSGTTSANGLSVTFTVTDATSGVSNLECALDGTSYVKCASPVAIPTLSNGPHSLKIRATDRALNLAEVSNINWTVDPTAPSISITAKPNPVVNSNTASFSFLGATGSPIIAKFECALDTAAFAECTSPKVLNSVSEGNHLFKVRGLTAAGAVSSVVSVAWTVDSMPPSLPAITSNLASITNLKAAAIMFTSNDGGSQIKGYKCALDAGVFVDCSSPWNISNLSEGVHSAKVKAVDNASNESLVSTYNWTVDSIPPVLIFTSVPNSSTTETSANFSFSASDAGSGIKSLECSIDSAPYTSCMSPKALTNLTIASHSLAVKAIDKANNQVSVIHNWSVTNMPSPTLTGTQLYTNNCQGCHNSLVTSTKLNRTASSISAAITGVPQMNGIKLNNSEIALIAQALVSTPSNPTGPIGSCAPGAVRGIAKEGVRRLTRPELIASLGASGFDVAAEPLRTALNEYPDPDEMEHVERFDQLYSSSQALSWAIVVDTITESLFAGQNLERISGACLRANPITDSCWNSFFNSFGRKVYRRPVTATEIARLINYAKSRSNATEAVKTAVTVMLRSPDFIFHLESGVKDEEKRVRLSDHEVANRISFALTSAPPDEQLSTSADKGELKTLAQVEAHAQRLINSGQAKPQIDRFYANWLQTSKVQTPGYEYLEWIMELSKTPTMDERYRQEIRDYVDYTTWKKKGSFKDLMTLEIAFPRFDGLDYGNGNKPQSALAGIYTNDKYSGFTPERATEALPYPAPNNPGLLTRAGLLASSRLSTDPIGRGVFMMRRILCRDLPTPDFAIINARLDEVGNLNPLTMPNHQIVNSKTGGTCMTCHSKINPLGFALEGYDMIGKLRPKEVVYDFAKFYNGSKGAVASHALPYPVSNIAIDETTISVSSPHQLANSIANSKEAQRCMTIFALRQFDRRHESAGDSCAVEEATQVLSSGRPLIDMFVKTVANEDVFWRRK